MDFFIYGWNCCHFFSWSTHMRRKFGTKITPRGGFLGPWPFLTLKSSHQDLSNEGSFLNFIKERFFFLITKFSYFKWPLKIKCRKEAPNNCKATIQRNIFFYITNFFYFKRPRKIKCIVNTNQQRGPNSCKATIQRKTFFPPYKIFLFQKKLLQSRSHNSKKSYITRLKPWLYI